MKRYTPLRLLCALCDEFTTLTTLNRKLLSIMIALDIFWPTLKESPMSHTLQFSCLFFPPPSVLTITRRHRHISTPS